MVSGLPGLSMATVHDPPAINERGWGLGLEYKWLAGLVSRVYIAGFVLGGQNTSPGEGGTTIRRWEWGRGPSMYTHKRLPNYS